MKLSLTELTYNLGHVLQQQGDLAAAASAYQQALEQSPTFAKARHSLAIVLGEQGEYRAAAVRYRQVIAQQPDAVRAYNNLACTLALQGREPEALRVYLEAIRRQPDWAVPYENLGRVLEARQPAAAAAAYRQAIALQPDLLSAHCALGLLLFQQKQIAAAVESLTRLLTLDPGHISAHATLGAARLSQDELALALPHFRQALLPQQAQISAFCDWVTQLQGDDQLTLARQACGRFLQMLLEDAPPVAEPRLVRRALGWLGRSRLGMQKPHSSAQIAGQLAQTYSRLGDLLMRYGGASQIQQAEVYYQQALRLQPQMQPHTDLYLKLGECLVKQDRLDAALMLYRLALVDCPDPRLDHSLGEILEQQSTNGRETSAQVTAPHVFTLTRRWCEQKSSTYISGHTPTYIPIDADCQPDSQIEAAAAELTPNSCAGLNCQPCLQKLAHRFERRHLGWGVYQVQASHLDLQPPNYFVAEIPQGQAWMTPYQTPWMVANSAGVLTADCLLLQDLCREYPGQLPDCPHRSLPVRLPQTCPEPVAGSTAVLTGLSGHNYFHWMVDILPRLALLRRSHDLNEIDWFWVNRPQAEFQQTTLRHLGVPAQKILDSDSQPFIQAERLIVPAFPGYLGWIEPWAIAFLRQQFLPLASPMPGYERIYISRRKAHHRRLLNEAAVLELLEPLGFQVVELESLALVDQISLFAHAKVILAPHGGGLTNMLFCDPGTTVVEFVTPSYIRQYYWGISQHLDLRHYFVTGVSPTCPSIHQLMYPSALVEDIWLNLSTLKNALRQIDLL